MDATTASMAPGSAAPATAAPGAAAKQNGAGHVASAVSTAALLGPHGHTPREVAAAAAAELQEADDAAKMATEWLALLGKGPVGDAAARAGLAGVAAAVILCSSPRWDRMGLVETLLLPEGVERADSFQAEAPLWQRFLNGELHRQPDSSDDLRLCT